MGGKAIMRRLRKLDDAQGFVGVFFDTDTYENGATVAQVAAWNEYGTEDIPSRPFMRQSFDENRKNLEQILEEGFGDLLDGKILPSSVLNKAGKELKTKMKKKIVDFKTPPNAPSTIRKKGFDNPLIHTKKLLRSIEFKKATDINKTGI